MDDRGIEVEDAGLDLSPRAKGKNNKIKIKRKSKNKINPKFSLHIT